ncbi:MAG: sulfatase-like hydrolase/transferase [Anaerolineaceae bacterium]|nr:sulfatase-like hydrolase/transferase [Anaerolineaceae bacterium]
MERPNVLILYTDQQRHDALGVNGNADIQTPVLDRLAREGVNFDHCFVQNPVCMPSRASFLSGRYPSSLGITHMGVPLPEDVVTLPHLLKPYGYRSANIGKLHFLPHANRDHRVPHPRYGFDHLEIADEPGTYEDAYRAWVASIAPEQLDGLSAGLPPGADVWYRALGLEDSVPHPHKWARQDYRGTTSFPAADDVTHTAFVAERTINFLQQEHGPFLCIAGFYSPHPPWIVPQRWLDLYDRQSLALPGFPPEVEARREAAGCTDDLLRSARHGYYAMVSEVDWHVGRLLQALEDRGLADNTIVILTSDHGEWLGEHLRWGKGYPGADAVSRVPLLVRWPAGKLHSGHRVSEVVEALDVLPSLLEMAGIQVPPHLQGSSLLPLLHGAQDDSQGSAMMEANGWKTLRTADFRYLVHDDGRESLRDLRADPREYHDVSGDRRYGEALSEHRHLLLQRLLSMERPLPRTWIY